MKYSHKQFGHVTFYSLVAVMIYIIGVCFYAYEKGELVGSMIWFLALFIFIFVLIFLSFYSMTISVESGELFLRLGIGIIKKKWNLDEIASATQVKNKWWYGWGIHYTPRGWLYNVSGMQGVEIELLNGKRFRLGTDDPKGLKEALTND